MLAENYPLAYFAERIGGPEVEVIVADVTSAGFQQAADCLLFNGHQMKEDPKAVDTTEAFRGRLAGGCASSVTWLDFSQAMKQADAVTDAMFRLVPGQAEFLALNHDLLIKELMELDVRMLAVGRKLAGQPILVSRDIYQDWARRYELNVSVAKLDAIGDSLATHPATWIIWEKRPAEGVALQLEAVGLRSLVFDPCATAPEHQSWKKVMESNVEAMEKMAGL